MNEPKLTLYKLLTGFEAMLKTTGEWPAEVKMTRRHYDELKADIASHNLLHHLNDTEEQGPVINNVRIIVNDDDNG